MIRPFGVIATIMWFVLCGLFLTVGIITSDVCLDPTTNIALASVNSDYYADFNFYLNCEGEGRLVNDALKLMTGTHKLDALMVNISASVDTCDEVGTQAWADVQLHYDSLSTHVYDLYMNTKCEVLVLNIHELLSESMCGDFLHMLKFMWIGMTISAVGLLVELWYFGSMNRKLPDDAYDDEGNVLESEDQKSQLSEGLLSTAADETEPVEPIGV
jgi:hypothetical protein